MGFHSWFSVMYDSIHGIKEVKLIFFTLLNTLLNKNRDFTSTYCQISWNLISPPLVCCKRRSQCGWNGTIFLKGWKELISPSSWCCIFLASHWIERRSEWKKQTLPDYDNTRHTREINVPQSYLYLTLLEEICNTVVIWLLFMLFSFSFMDNIRFNSKLHWPSIEVVRVCKWSHYFQTCKNWKHLLFLWYILSLISTKVTFSLESQSNLYSWIWSKHYTFYYHFLLLTKLLYFHIFLYLCSDLYIFLIKGV